MSRLIALACSKTIISTDFHVAKSLTNSLAAIADHDSLASFSRLLLLSPLNSSSSPPRRTFCLSPTLADMKAWDKRKYKGRKPRSLGRAPTKLELVDPDPTLDDEEEKLVAQWKKQYEVDMAHCYDLMREKSVMDSLDTGAAKRAIQEEKIHHATMMKENEEWNSEVGALRERDFAELRLKEEEAIRATVAATLEAKAVRRAEVMAYVDRVQEESRAFINLDNIEEKVNEAMEAPIVDYNFSVDRNGNVYRLDRDPALLS